MAIVINAKAMKEEQVVSLREESRKIQEVIGRKPKLVIINASDDFGSKRYIKNKITIGEEVEIDVEVVEFQKEATTETISELMHKLRNAHDSDAVILQQPTYSHIDDEELIGTIAFHRDADCFSNRNLGKMMQGDLTVMPCTPAGAIDILDYHRVDIEGKRVTIIGRSVHVGLSLAVLLTQRGAVVTTTHSKTPSLEDDIRNADIVISAVGRDRLIKPEWMKKGAVLLGVGIVFREEEPRKQFTDYDIEDMVRYSGCSVVGDRVNTTGTATVLNLMKNTINLTKQKYGIK